MAPTHQAGLIWREHHVREDAATCGLFRGLPSIKDISEDSFERKANIMSLRLRYACRFAGYEIAELCPRKRLASFQMQY